MLRGKERKKRNEEQICKVKQRQMKKIYIQKRLTVKKQESPTKEYMQKKYKGFKAIKVKIIKKRKEKNGRKKKKNKRKTPQNCKNQMLMQKFITTIKNVTEYTHIHICS